MKAILLAALLAVTIVTAGQDDPRFTPTPEETELFRNIGELETAYAYTPSQIDAAVNLMAPLVYTKYRNRYEYKLSYRRQRFYQALLTLFVSVSMGKQDITEARGNSIIAAYIPKEVERKLAALLALEILHEIEDRK